MCARVRVSVCGCERERKRPGDKVGMTGNEGGEIGAFIPVETEAPLPSHGRSSLLGPARPWTRRLTPLPARPCCSPGPDFAATPPKPLAGASEGAPGVGGRGEASGAPGERRPAGSLPCHWLFIVTCEYFRFRAQGGWTGDSSLCQMTGGQTLSLPGSYPSEDPTIHGSGPTCPPGWRVCSARAGDCGPGWDLDDAPCTSGGSARLGVGGTAPSTTSARGPPAVGHRTGGRTWRVLARRAGPGERGRRSRRTRMSMGPRGSETSTCHPDHASGPLGSCAKKAVTPRPVPTLQDGDPALWTHPHDL